MNLNDAVFLALHAAAKLDFLGKNLLGRDVVPVDRIRPATAGADTENLLFTNLLLRPRAEFGGTGPGISLARTIRERIKIAPACEFWNNAWANTVQPTMLFPYPPEVHEHVSKSAPR